MMDQLLCLKSKNGKKVIDIEKLLARLTYVGAGVGVSMAAYHMKEAIKNAKA